MGSFNATCIISNLQIEAGTPVRFFLLTASRFSQGNGHDCYVWGRWQLRGAAVRAKYNDYGSVEDLKESLTSRVMFEALSRDAVEKGVGDNQCHDVHVRPGMPQEEWLEALWEGRVFVKDQFFRFDPNWKAPEPEEGIPSLARIEKVLAGAGLKTVTDYGADGYVIDEVGRGFFRVRHGRFGDTTEALEQVVPLLHQASYAAMLTCGTGNYPNQNGEVLVAPLPKAEQHFFSAGVGEDLDRNPPRAVSQVMVREDVWQILLRTRIRTWSSDEPYTFKRYKKDALAWLERAQKAAQKERDPVAALHDQHFDRDNLFSQGIHGGEGVSGFSLRMAFLLGIKLAANEKELQQYVLDLAEMSYVQWVYGAQLHGQWHPTTNSSQEGHWKEHRAFHKKLSKLRGRYEE